MRRRTRLVIGSLTAVLLAFGQLAGGGAAGSASGPPPGADTAAGARGRLVADATSSLTVDRDASGAVAFAGVAAGGRIDNPSVTRSAGVVTAARAHLDRYGAALGVDRPGTSLVRPETTHAVSGQDVVRFQQAVDGVPVIGGEVVVSLRPDRDLGSLLSTLSRRTKVPPVVVEQDAAAAEARAAAAKSGRLDTQSLQVGREGRWLFDPAALGAPAGAGARTVWRFEVTSGDAVRRLVLVDDQTGAILLDIDQIQRIDRVVCDNANVLVASESPCTSGFARTEGGAASGVADVNAAYDLSGAVSDFYAQIGGIDLTAALGIDVGGVKKLASTVRLCLVGYPCPFGNAFWNGQQMYYGQDYASADDVVGHEMTHGIIDQYSQLFYWGQSGAINESLADIMGEIVDHRHPSAGDSPTSWGMGEDLPIGAIRNLADPTLFSDPDRMTSPSYQLDPSYTDNGGVHSNSGVGNKTAYLVSQGGSFNGQTITGIDGADTGLAKTAKLYLNVIQSLSSGSDYADLGRVLDQSCQDLVTAGSPGFTTADCTAVHQAGLATELATTPTNAPQPPDAPASCPADTTKRVLFDSETGDPGSKFVKGTTWARAPDDAGSLWGSNATSGVDSWYSRDPASITSAPLMAANAVSLPAGQPSYLWFQHWRLLEFGGSSYYDGGTVEVDDWDSPDPPQDVSGLPWVNGPTQVLSSSFGNPKGGMKSFSGDSRGFVASRVDLSSYAGKAVKPQFTMNTDGTTGYVGWFLDDITVYTCDSVIHNAAVPTIAGSAVQGRLLTALPGSWSPADVTFSYQWLRNGGAIPGASGPTYRLAATDRGTRIAVRVTAARAGSVPVSATSAQTSAVLGLLTTRKPTISGVTTVGRRLTAKPGAWLPSGITFSYRWLRNGSAIAGATGKTYVLKRADRGKRIQVKVTGRRAGYLAASRVSDRTPAIRG